MLYFFFDDEPMSLYSNVLFDQLAGDRLCSQWPARCIGSLVDCFYETV